MLLVCGLVVMCVQAVGDHTLGTFAFVFDAGPFRVREYESVVIGFGTRVEVACVYVYLNTRR